MKGRTGTFAVAIQGVFVLLALGAVPGCSRGPETIYGSSRGSSVNGTGAFADLLRLQGHEVRTAWHLTDELAGWANVVVRFASIPGPPDHEEAQWYADWLESEPGRSLVYVVRDYDAEAEYWTLVVDQLSAPTEAGLRSEAETRRDRASHWTSRLPNKAAKAADAESWFMVDRPVDPMAPCKTLAGPWADSIDARQAAIPLHEPLLARNQDVLLTGDGHVLAMQWRMGRGRNVLAFANGSFLLNLGLVNRARRALAEETAAWIGDAPRRIAFVDGPSVVGDARGPKSLIELMRDDSRIRWVILHLGLFGLVACLARAPRLGRPRPDPPSEADRPAAHAEALGSLLEQARAGAVARSILAAYHRWRLPRAPQEAGRLDRAACSVRIR
jgi:hypothetical protein